MRKALRILAYAGHGFFWLAVLFLCLVALSLVGFFRAVRAGLRMMGVG